MKNIVDDPISLRKAFIRFAAIMALLSALGGYLLSHLVSRMNDASAQRSVRLLEIEEHLDDAAIGLGRQIQEWKNILLRAGNKELYSRHLGAFKDASIGVQYALLDAKRTMQMTGMDTTGIDHLIIEHKSILSEPWRHIPGWIPGQEDHPVKWTGASSGWTATCKATSPQ
jgi:hypothetical protein